MIVEIELASSRTNFLCGFHMVIPGSDVNWVPFISLTFYNWFLDRSQYLILISKGEKPKDNAGWPTESQR